MKTLHRKTVSSMRGTRLFVVGCKSIRLFDNTCDASYCVGNINVVVNGFEVVGSNSDGK